MGDEEYTVKGSPEETTVIDWVPVVEPKLHEVAGPEVSYGAALEHGCYSINRGNPISA
jgi:hypothetical protein